MKKIVAFIIVILTISMSFAQTEFGVASYYGTQFHGRTTASGEKYNQFALTAAHKTLPLGTICKVTNEKNNKSVYVKINDRGPYVKGRVIDLSTKAADLLGYRSKGTANVKIEIVEPESIPTDLMTATQNVADQNGIQEYSTDTTAVSENTAVAESDTSLKEEVAVVAKTKTKKLAIAESNKSQPQPVTDLNDANSKGITNRSTYFIITKLDKSKSGFYGLQLGVFSDMNVIFSIIAELEERYHQALLVEQEDLNGKTVYKLFIGKFANKAYADALKLSLSDKYKDAFVLKYE